MDFKQKLVYRKKGSLYEAALQHFCGRWYDAYKGVGKDESIALFDLLQNIRNERNLNEYRIYTEDLAMNAISFGEITEEREYDCYA